MESRGSYRLREHFRGVEAELARLEAQATHLWSKEIDVLLRRGLPVRGPLLEIGSGPGFITGRLLELAGGGVTAVDNDPEMIALARERLGSQEGVTIVEASVEALPFEDGSFAAATARFVFQHLVDPAPALAELRRVLEPGARLFVTDTDDGCSLLLDPEPPHLSEVTQAIGGLQSERGGNREIGRALPRLFLHAGFADIAVDLVAVHSVVDGPRTVVDIIGGVTALEGLVAQGLISRAVFDDLKAYSDRFERGDVEVDGLLAAFVVSGSA